jgi:hypothetical protein
VVRRGELTSRVVRSLLLPGLGNFRALVAQPSGLHAINYDKGEGLLLQAPSPCSRGERFAQQIQPEGRVRQQRLIGLVGTFNSLLTGSGNEALPFSGLRPPTLSDQTLVLRDSATGCRLVWTEPAG